MRRMARGMGYRGSKEPPHYFERRPPFCHFLASILRILAPPRLIPFILLPRSERARSSFFGEVDGEIRGSFVGTNC